MTDFLQLVSTLREQMNATLSRSDVLRPLAWLIGILALMLVGALYEKAPTFVLIIVTCSLVLGVMLYAGAYVFCLVCDRDALRSERYSLHKMAIEHGYYGDSQIGLMQPEGSKSTSGLPVAIDVTPTGQQQ